MSSWRGKKVFLTGHTGFKGGWLASWLLQAGAEVTGYALAPETNPNLFDLLNLKSHLNSVLADIRDEESLTKALVAAKPDVVFHLAAQPLVRRSYRSPIETYQVNVMGTAHVLEAVRKTPSVRTVVAVTTDKCYENREWVWPYREEDPLGGYDPYSSSKACAEILTASYRQSFFAQSQVAIASARAGNVIGGGDWSEDRLIPDAVRSVTSKQPLIVRRPRSQRPWQHVLEPLAGYIRLAELLEKGNRHLSQAFNFGPGPDDALSVQQVLGFLEKSWNGNQAGPFQWKIEEDPNAVHEAMLLQLDSSKARSLLGWRPKLRLHQAIEWTADWYKMALSEPRSCRQLTEKQIQTYQKA